MRWPLVILTALVAPAAEPLPKELAERLDLARMLPDSIGASVMVKYLAPAKIDPAQKAGLALEAYLMATAFGNEAPPAYAARSVSPLLQWLRVSNVEAMNPLSAAIRAWKLYEENYDRRRDKPLDFPARRVAKAETCRAAFVDDPYDYYEAAYLSSRKIFLDAATQAHNAIELGRLAGAALLIPPNQRPVDALERLLLATSTDRQFAYAMEMTPLHNAILQIAREGGAAVTRRLLPRYAAFLERHFGQRRCTGNDSLNYWGVIDEFNRAAAEAERLWTEVKLPRLAENAGRAKALDVESYVEKDEDFRDLVLLRFKITGVRPDEVNSTAILNAVDAFQPPSKLPATLRQLQKNYAYQALARELRGSAAEQKVMTAWLRHIAVSRLQREAPQVWWAAVRDILEWAGKNPQRRALAEFAGDPALAAWLRLNALDPQ